jgi:hypothetical protein
LQKPHAGCANGLTKKKEKKEKEEKDKKQEISYTVWKVVPYRISKLS